MKIERVISNMLKENTGTHFLDSGGTDGRAYQKNKDIDFNKTKSVEVDLWTNEDGIEVNLTRSLYWYLLDNLSITDTSKMLNKTFKDGTDKDTSYLTEMEEFIDVVDVVNQNGEYSNKIYNSYNGESSLSQVIQYGIFGFKDKTYIILQIHNGCDVRGGYTEPKIFELNDLDLWYGGFNDFNSNDGHYTDDGYNWYDENGNKVNINDIWYIKDDKLFNKETNKEVIFR